MCLEMPPKNVAENSISFKSGKSYNNISGRIASIVDCKLFNFLQKASKSINLESYN